MCLRDVIYEDRVPVFFPDMWGAYPIFMFLCQVLLFFLTVRVTVMVATLQMF